MHAVVLSANGLLEFRHTSWLSKAVADTVFRGCLCSHLSYAFFVGLSLMPCRNCLFCYFSPIHIFDFSGSVIIEYLDIWRGQQMPASIVFLFPRKSFLLILVF